MGWPDYELNSSLDAIMQTKHHMSDIASVLEDKP